MEIRGFIANAYGRPVTRESLSPQLSRLYGENLIYQPEEGRWKLRPEDNVRAQILSQYGIVVTRSEPKTRGEKWYDHDKDMKK